MYNNESVRRRFYAVCYDEETTAVSAGSLIPVGQFSYTPAMTTGGVAEVRVSYTTRLARYRGWVLGLLVAITAVTSGTRIDGQQLMASLSTLSVAPTVLIENPYPPVQTPLNYGVDVTFPEPNFFNETRETFINSQQTFVEVNLSTKYLRFFVAGVLQQEVPIYTKGASGSWWETPAGLYDVTFKKDNLFSAVGQVYLPWSIGFQGNFIIHGWPKYPNGEPVPEDYPIGGIRLADEDAKLIYQLVAKATPILVYEEPVTTSKFVYEPKIPELVTPHYLIADIESSTVLASSDLDAVAPIASITKLMTALVAAEHINLDKSVNIIEPTFVQSLIPRLSERNRVSMYSLLQLLLSESSNEAADVIADQLGRSQFIIYMNKKAQAIGMENTVFADPSGLSSDNVSTVRDLLRLVQYLRQNHQFIIALTRDQNLSTAYTGGEFGKLTNFNFVKGTDNFLGGKVGETMAAGQTSVTLHTLSVKGEERTIVIIILGSQSRNEDVLQLLAYAQAHFSY